jgi:GPI mannosyltransferase 1 subunit M
VPILASRIKISLKKSIFLFILWLVGQALWLFYAYKLEFEGENTFVQLWFSSLVFLLINCFIMKSGFIDTYELEDLKIKKDE